MVGLMAMTRRVIKMNEKEYKKLQKKNKLVKIDKRIFGDNALAIESILNGLIIKNRTNKQTKKGK